VVTGMTSPSCTEIQTAAISPRPSIPQLLRSFAAQPGDALAHAGQPAPAPSVCWPKARTPSRWLVVGLTSAPPPSHTASPRAESSPATHPPHR
jgi:hypothetical protein